MTVFRENEHGGAKDGDSLRIAQRTLPPDPGPRDGECRDTFHEEQPSKEPGGEMGGVIERVDENGQPNDHPCDAEPENRGRALTQIVGTQQQHDQPDHVFPFLAASVLCDTTFRTRCAGLEKLACFTRRPPRGMRPLQWSKTSM